VNIRGFVQKSFSRAFVGQALYPKLAGNIPFSSVLGHNVRVIEESQDVSTSMN
jgi:predicted N-acyltransferase